jgi:Leucine-rich repeat (LRR) protein
LLLYNNHLTRLPTTLSSLKELKTLDISNNNFTNITHIIPGLKSLPNLQNLIIDIHDNDEETSICKALPNLNQLNGSHPSSSSLK